MQPGELVKHKIKGEWGVGVVVETPTNKCVINFEHKHGVMLLMADVERLLDVVSSDDLPDGSAFLDRTRWATIGKPAPVPRTRATKRRTCAHCSKALKQSRYSTDRRLKSCPKCSVTDGQRHVFYEYPEAFGQTETPASDETPDGPQSYCTACRTDRT